MQTPVLVAEAQYQFDYIPIFPEFYGPGMFDWMGGIDVHVENLTVIESYYNITIRSGHFKMDLVMDSITEEVNDGPIEASLELTFDAEFVEVEYWSGSTYIYFDFFDASGIITWDTNTDLVTVQIMQPLWRVIQDRLV